MTIRDYKALQMTIINYKKLYMTENAIKKTLAGVRYTCQVCLLTPQKMKSLIKSAD